MRMQPSRIPFEWARVDPPKKPPNSPSRPRRDLADWGPQASLPSTSSFGSPQPTQGSAEPRRERRTPGRRMPTALNKGKGTRRVALLMLAAGLCVTVGPAVSAGARPAEGTATAQPRAVAARTYPDLLLVGKLTRRIKWSKLPAKVVWDGTKAGDIPRDLQAVYRGQTIYKIIGLVDDKKPGSFNVALAKKGYTIRFMASDGYHWDFKSRSIIGKKKWIIARLKNGKPLPAGEGPYRDVGSFIHHFYGRQSVKLLVEIKLIF